MNKYLNKKVVVDWIVFDSKQEASFYRENKNKIKAVHPSYLLQKKFKKYWKTIRSIYYIADFELLDWTVIDVKWMPTETAKLKKKLFDYMYPEKTLLRVVKYKWERVNYESNEKRKKLKNK